jgi:hypothetical protein
MRAILLSAAAGFLSLARVASAAPPAPVDPVARDTPNDGGHAVTITWAVPAGVLHEDEVEIRRVAPDGTEHVVGRVHLHAGSFVDGSTAEGESGPDDGVPYRWRLVVLRGAEASAPVTTGPASASAQLFHRERVNVLIILGVIAAFVLANIAMAKGGARDFYIRKLAPIDAMDEAIGRATEMGRPVLYVPGIEEVDDIQTIASMLILERVAEKTALYDVHLEVPTRTPFVLAIADEVVKNGCAAAGRPDAYRPDSVRYISSEQFAYCAGVNGMILRERPAANLYLGKFYAESLIFAETGFAAGSIQIAGTAEVTQLPFFIAACDYTLIGEEFFAASAYMSRDPSLLSTIRAADWAKIALVTALLLGAVFQSLDVPGFRAWFQVR